MRPVEKLPCQVDPRASSHCACELARVTASGESAEKADEPIDAANSISRHPQQGRFDAGSDAQSMFSIFRVRSLFVSVKVCRVFLFLAPKLRHLVFIELTPRGASLEQDRLEVQSHDKHSVQNH